MRLNSKRILSFFTTSVLSFSLLVTPTFAGSDWSHSDWNDKKVNKTSKDYNYSDNKSSNYSNKSYSNHSKKYNKYYKSQSNKHKKYSRKSNKYDNRTDKTSIYTHMSGNQEVPGPGDHDGYGVSKITIHPDKNHLCASIRVFKIAPATAAHIHKAPKGVAGPVVVHLPTPNHDGYAEGCVSADSKLLKDIANNPTVYYVNVHNSPYPDGAIRGQLHH
jgi:hypothetical protein